MWEFLHMSVISIHFKAVIDQATALAWQANDCYVENTNRHQINTTAYHVKDRVMMNMRNYKPD
jgi:hypothetical protein